MLSFDCRQKKIHLRSWTFICSGFVKAWICAFCSSESCFTWFAVGAWRWTLDAWIWLGREHAGACPSHHARRASVAGHAQHQPHCPEGFSGWKHSHFGFCGQLILSMTVIAQIRCLVHSVGTGRRIRAAPQHSSQPKWFWLPPMWFPSA